MSGSTLPSMRDTMPCSWLAPAQHEPVDRIAVRVAHGAVAIVDLLSLRSAVAAHGHPAGIDDGPAFLGLVPDDGRQHRQRDILRACRPRHWPSPDRRPRRLRPALRSLRRDSWRTARWAWSRRSPPDRTCRLRAAFRPRERIRALLLRQSPQRFRRIQIVGAAGVGHHALERRAAIMQHAADLDQAGSSGCDAGAVAVAVDLDHHVEGVPFCLALGDDRGCRPRSSPRGWSVRSPGGAAPAPGRASPAGCTPHTACR